VDSPDLAARLESEFGPRAYDRLGAEDGPAFTARLARVLPDAVRTLDQLYGRWTDTSELARTLVGDALDHAAVRDEPLRQLDRAREDDPGWFQDPRMIGYVCYIDRFAGTLAGVRTHLDYLAELGVTYLHLMSLLKPRDGNSDGGYAVADYDAVDPRIGSMTELTELAGDMHRRGLALCVDMVLNHTAREHAWARKAAAGDPFYRGFYLVYPDRSEPDAFERTLPDIFPEIAPGNFTYDAELAGWVWTTFNSFQWDLNYANPDVFRFMLQTMLRLANRGADVLRLDAAPFLWKRLGTNCMNQPETHLLLQAFRALTRLAAPGLLLKAEAMVGPDQLGKYLGDHDVYRPECDLAYDNQLMVMLWSATATGDTRLAAQALNRRRPAPPSTSWATFVRCHDDIGWAVSHTDTAAVGLDAHLHRKLLSDFYAGKVAGSFARGEVFQDRPDGESPISGTLASLCGVEAALADGDAAGLELALRRLESMYSVVFSFGGIPLLYMGDELALRNDPRYRDDPAHRHDNRWLHRPAMDWAAANARADLSTVRGRAYAALRRLAAARIELPSLSAAAPTRVLRGGDPALLTYLRGTPGHRPVLATVNVSATPRSIGVSAINAAGIGHPVHIHSTTGTLDVVDGQFKLPGCGFVWVGDA
jgi:amylosucrase